MRVVAARQGETLSEVGAPTGNAWDINESAVANGLFVDSVLEAGQLVKVAIEEPYRPRGSRVSPPAQ
jgi:hypothetical protein